MTEAGWTKEKPTYTPSLSMKWNRKTGSWETVWRRISEKLVSTTSGCWVWNGTTKGGEECRRYGYVYICEKHYYVHRIVYELFKGPVPHGLVLDHICRVPTCVNPEHLEAVTNVENIMRGNAPGIQIQRVGICKNGHERTGENMRTYRGRSFCRSCERERSTRRRNGN